MNLATELRAAGLRVTPQRLVLFETLRDLGRHATAEELLRAAAPRLPGLSAPTVYATLELLAQLGLVREIDAGSGATLFDPVADGHAHLHCTRCGKVIDVPEVSVSPALLRRARAAGHQPVAAELVLTGRCADCAAN